MVVKPSHQLGKWLILNDWMNPVIRMIADPQVCAKITLMTHPVALPPPLHLPLEWHGLLRSWQFPPKSWQHLASWKNMKCIQMALDWGGDPLCELAHLVPLTQHQLECISVHLLSGVPWFFVHRCGVSSWVPYTLFQSVFFVVVVEIRQTRWRCK